MKIFKKIAIILLFLLALTTPVQAGTYRFSAEDDVDIHERMYSDLRINELTESVPREFADFARRTGITPQNPFSFWNLFSQDGAAALRDYLLSHITSPLSSVAVMLLAVVVCAVIGSMSDNTLGAANTPNIVAVLVCTAAFMIPLTTLIVKTISTVTTVSTFMLTLIPVLAGILIAALRAGTAAAIKPILFFAAQAVSYVAAYIILPFTNCYLAVSVAGCVSGENRLSGISSMLKKAALFCIGGGMTVFLAVLSMQNLITGVVDNAGVRTTRFFITSFIPVIGAPLSEALGSLQASIGVLKASAGLYAVIVILFMTVPLIIELLLYKTALSFSSSAAGIFGVTQVKDISSALNGGLSIVLAIILCVTIMFVFAVTSVALSARAV